MRHTTRHITADWTLSIVAALGIAACARSATVESAGSVSPAVVPATSSTLPAGSTLRVRLNETLGTKQSKVGDEFTATVVNNVTAQNGTVIVPAGATVKGKVTGLKASENAGEQAVIRLDFASLSINGSSYPFAAQVAATNLRKEGETKDETLKKAGMGAAAGAVLGAIISGGDLDKILLGGALGAAAGTAISLGTGDVEAVLPAGSELTLRTTQQISLR